MPEGELSGAGLILQTSDDGKTLLAVFKPVVAMAPSDTGWIKRKIEDEGYAHLFIFPDALGKVVKKYNCATGFTLTIGERRDGSFSINIDKDFIAAQLTMTPSYGGRGVTGEDINRA